MAENFCHPENPGSTHWSGCDCHEAAWAEKLAAAEERGRRYRAEMEFLREWLLKFHGSINFATVVAMRERLRAALAPPPEAEKKGGNDGK